MNRPGESGASGNSVYPPRGACRYEIHQLKPRPAGSGRLARWLGNDDESLAGAARSPCDVPESQPRPSRSGCGDVPTTRAPASQAGGYEPVGRDGGRSWKPGSRTTCELVYAYSGLLTTPGCTQDVRWSMVADGGHVSKAAGSAQEGPRPAGLPAAAEVVSRACCPPW